MGGMSASGSPVMMDRVVAVVATLRDGREQLGSDYLVTSRLVLTAEHCTRNKVTGEPAAWLRVVRASDGAEAQAAEVVPDRGLDVAALRLPDDTPWITNFNLPPSPGSTRATAECLTTAQVSPPRFFSVPRPGGPATPPSFTVRSTRLTSGSPGG